MAKKEFTFKGKKLEELQKLSLEDFTALLPSRQRRTLTRGLKEEQKKLIKKAQAWKAGQKPIRTHRRDTIILPDMVGKEIAVHNGKDWNIVRVKQEMLGQRLGEFSLTRKGIKHSGPGIGATRGTKFVSAK